MESTSCYRECENENCEKMPAVYNRRLSVLVLCIVPILIFFGLGLAFQYNSQKNVVDELTQLRNEIDIIKLHLRSQMEMNSRHRREADAVGESDPDSGVVDGVPIVYDSPYGVNFKTKQSLSVYPTLQGNLSRLQSSSNQQNLQGGSSIDSSGSNGPGSQGSTTTNYNYHYLGIRRHVPHEDSTQPPAPAKPVKVLTAPSKDKDASAYAKRLNTFRHSRVSQTIKHDAEDQDQVVPQPLPLRQVPDQREQLQFQAAKPEIAPYKRPEVRSLDSGSGEKDLISVHYQARVSVADESSSNLATGLHDSWRLSHWSKLHKGSKLFGLTEASGQMSVPQTGLYFVYAQVEYLDNHDTNGYEIYVNNEPFISCVTSTHAPKEKKKHNTCYTAAVAYIEEGGLLHVRDKEAGRYSLLHSTGTFFGATKISPSN